MFKIFGLEQLRKRTQTKMKLLVIFSAILAIFIVSVVDASKTTDRSKCCDCPPPQPPSEICSTVRCAGCPTTESSVGCCDCPRPEILPTKCQTVRCAACPTENPDLEEC